MKPRTVYLPDELVENVDLRSASLGFKSFAKYALHLIEEDLKKGVNEGSIKEERPLTLQEQHDSTVSELARIRATLGPKYDVMKHIVKRVLKLAPTKESDVEPAIDALWDYISRRNGFVEFKEKGYPIERKDVDLFRTYGLKQCQVRDLRAKMAAGT